MIDGILELRKIDKFKRITRCKGNNPDSTEHRRAGLVCQNRVLDQSDFTC